MPYIITTKQPVAARDAHGIDAWDLKRAVSRRAVATLAAAQDNLRERVTSPIPGYQLLLSAAVGLTREGGTVGPLPDGTVIEVKRVAYEDLQDDPWYYGTDAVASISTIILDAYNAAQEV